MKFYDLKKALESPDIATELNIHNRNLKEVPNQIRGLKNLKKLTLSTNEIDSLPYWLPELKRLETLELPVNQIKEFPEVLGKITNLKNLNLSGNQVSLLPTEAHLFQNISGLNLSNNLLREIPSVVFTPVLKSLELSSNPIEKLPKAIGRALNLVNFSIRYANLKKLPAAITKCIQLRNVHLNNNQLRNLPAGIGSLTRLEKLSLEHNRIKQLPKDIGHCSWLRDLVLHHNKIETLPDSIGNLAWLFRLQIQSNKLSDVPESLGQCTKLKHLNLEYNKLESLPDSLFNLTNLEQLLLKGNAIRLKKSNLMHWPRLKKISGLQSVFDTRSRKEVLTFLKYCRAKQFNLPERKALYQLLIQDQPGPKNILLMAAGFPIKRLRDMALIQLFERFNARKSLQRGAHLVICGKTQLAKKNLGEALRNLGIHYSTKISKQTTHIVLGHFPSQVQALSRYTFSFLREQDLQQFLINHTEHRLNQFSKEEEENLNRLLLSNEPANVKLAIEILKTGKVTSEMLTPIFLAYKTNSSLSIKRQLKKVLVLHGSDELNQKLSMRISLGENIQQDRLVKNVQILAENSELDEEKMLAFLC